MACLLAADTGLARLRGESFSLMRRPGYELAFLGTPLFALGGVGDLAWHQLFGIERGIEALLSPTHLLLITSMIMIVSAPFRSQRSAMQAQHWPEQLRRVLSLTLVRRSNPGHHRLPGLPGAPHGNDIGAHPTWQTDARGIDAYVYAACSWLKCAE